MQNQNLWTDSYSVTGYSGKCWNTSNNPDSHEIDDSFIISSTSQPADCNNEIFTYCNSDDISTNSIQNMASVTDSSIIPCSSTDTETVEKKYGGIFSNNSCFIESEHSSVLSSKYSEETDVNQINGQAEAAPSFELPTEPNEVVSSLSLVQRSGKRRNSLPPDYPNYKKKLSIDCEAQSLCGVETLAGSDSNSFFDMNSQNDNEESSWSNCYAPYRKHPTSVASSERGAESLIDKLFSEEQKRRYEALKKKSSKRMDSKRKKEKDVDFGSVYKSFVEVITHSSQNLSEITDMDVSPQKEKEDSIMSNTDTKMHESTGDDCTIHGVSIDIDSKDSQQMILTANSIPDETNVSFDIDSKDSHQMMLTVNSVSEETNTDSILESDQNSVDAVSYQQDTVHMDYDVTDDGQTSDNLLVQISSSDDCANHKVYADVDVNSKDSHKVMSTPDFMAEDFDPDLISKSNNLSVNVVSNQQDTIHMNCDVADGHTSENVLVLNSGDDLVHEVSANTDDDSKDSQQVIFNVDTMPEKNNAEIKSESEYLTANTDSVRQDVISVNYNSNGLNSETIFSPAVLPDKISVDTGDNFHQAVFITDSVPKTADVISESDCLLRDAESNEQDVLVDHHADEHTSENNLVSDVSSDVIASNINNNSKDPQNVTFVADSYLNETNADVISESDHITVHANSNQQIVMTLDCVTNELTSENVLVPVSSSDTCDNSDSQQVIFITDTIPKVTDAEIILESDCLTSQTNSNEQQIFAINDDVDQIASDEMLVYVQCSDGYRLCKLSTNLDINSENSQQITFITNSAHNETDNGLISDSNCYIINAESNQQDTIPISYTDGAISERDLVPVSEVLFKTVPLADQNIDLKTEMSETQLYDPVVDKGDANNSAGNLTNDEISDSLDKIFTQTTESDVLYSIPEEQREVPFDFDGEKLISLDTNISTEASLDTYTAISETSEETIMHEQLVKATAETGPNSEGKENISSAEYYLENKNSTHINQEDMMLVDEKQNSLNISVENPNINKQIKKRENSNTHIDLCSINTEKVFEIRPDNLDNTEMEICNEESKVFNNPDGDSESHQSMFYKDMKVVYENLCEQNKKSEISSIDVITSENNKNDEINQFLVHCNSTNEIFHDTLGKTSDTSSKELHMNVLSSISMTESSNILFDTEIKSKAFSNEQLDECGKNSKVETSDFIYQDNYLNRKSSLESQNSSYKCRTSKARKSTSKSSALKTSTNEVLKVIENNIANEVFNLMESKENLPSCNSSFVPEEQVAPNISTLSYILSDSEAENVPLTDNGVNFVPDLEMKSLQKSKSLFETHFNGTHKNGTAKKSFLKISDRSSSDEMSNNCDMQNSIASSDSESDSVSSKCRKTVQYLSDRNNTEISNPTRSFSAVESISVLRDNLGNAKQRTALKTFKKPFTVAKKSVTEKSSFKTVFQSYFGIRTAKKTYNKSPNKKLLNTNLDESSSSVEELSADEAKNSTVIWSPVKDLQLKVCTCSAVEVPCLCNGEQLQLICEAEDTIDEKVVPCTKSVSQQYLLTPSSEIKHRAFCDIHLWRLRKHHCCPKCGIFCTQGSFFCCSYDHPAKGGKETHFFHPNCFLLPDTGLPPGCPHCCTFSDFKNVNFSLIEGVPEEPLTQSPDKCSEELNITEDLENYTILMKIQDVESETVSKVCTIPAPPTQDLKTMLMAITKEPSLRLRPTGKCLFNPIKVGDIKKVIQLIANGVDPNHKFNQHKNNTPLHIAAFYGCIGIVHILIQYGASIDAVNDDLETPFILAVEKDQMAVVRYLVHTGTEIDVKNENGLTAFHIACKNNSKELAKFLYSSGKFDINLQDDGGWTPLVWACEHNYGDLVQWLLENGADPNVRDNEQNTALHWAACSGNSEILEMLLENGCNLSFVNQRGDSALHIAARKDNWACVKLLLARNASLDCINKDGETPITKCYCKDNCSSSDCTCTRISKCWYDMNGCLLHDFDMYDPPTLYECHKTCHCPKTCINRVVQKGLRYPLQLFRTLNRGWGVRALKDLARGTFVCEYVGEVISDDEINQRTDDTYLFDLDSKTGDNCIDGRFYGNISRFINHSCEPNLISVEYLLTTKT
ncbi:Histone-lysine N-methyltransferase EHMT1 like protein [Argiope bruennichi]|uniref:Histone-lysine N-methyltransferase EHMT1 like protein n=1 Tax=Argiope bruennichi TaxID=94029 RepID=A0A8T0G134_ARGBR|nr:Histone-lysine N-methyltransferase EHMT1 like protein [Argiope bruennichi]